MTPAATPPKPRGTPWTRKEIDRMCELRRSGLEAADVARALGRPLATVRNYWHLYGTPSPAAPVLTPRQLGALRRAHAAGLSDHACARRVGCDRKTARYRLRQMGLTANGKRGGDPASTAGSQRWLLRNGYASRGEWSRERARVAAAALGWPQAPGPAIARALDVLHRAGAPLAFDDFASRLGRHLKSAWRALGQCVRLGLAARSGSRPALYALAHGVRKGGGATPAPDATGEAARLVAGALRDGPATAEALGRRLGWRGARVRAALREAVALGLAEVEGGKPVVYSAREGGGC